MFGNLRENKAFAIGLLVVALLFLGFMAKRYLFPTSGPAVNTLVESEGMAGNQAGYDPGLQNSESATTGAVTLPERPDAASAGTPPARGN